MMASDQMKTSEEDVRQVKTKRRGTYVIAASTRVGVATRVLEKPIIDKECAIANLWFSPELLCSSTSIDAHVVSPVLPATNGWDHELST